jgi:uncharacterized membrane protein
MKRGRRECAIRVLQTSLSREGEAKLREAFGAEVIEV